MDCIGELLHAPSYHDEIDRYRDICVQPDFSPSGDNEIEFTLGGANDPSCTMLSGPFAPSLSGYIKVVAEDGSALKENEVVIVLVNLKIWRESL